MKRYILGLAATVQMAATTVLHGATIYTPEAFSSRLGTIETGNAAAHDIGSFDIPNGGFAPNVSFDTDGTLYTMVNWLADNAGNARSQLATVDMTTGTIAEVGSHATVNMVATEIDARGTMYGAGFNAPLVVPDAGLGLHGDTMLYRISKITGQVTPIGDTGIERLMDMSFRPSDGAFFGTVANKLYRIDPDTGASELTTEITGVVEATGVEGAEIMGIMFDENDTLYATSFFGGAPDYVSPLFTIDTSTGVTTVVGNPGFVNPHGGDIMLPPPPLQAGDANQDLRFNQFDLIQVQQAAKYLTGETATWGEGDWNGAPGGKPGQAPVGDAVFDQQDITEALTADTYLTGAYAVVKKGGVTSDEQTSLVCDTNTGELSVDAPQSKDLTSINTTSAGSRFLGDKPTVLDGAFDNFSANSVFKATFGGSFGDISLGVVLPMGLSEDDVASDLSAVGSLDGGGDLGEVDLVYVPEPSAILLLIIGLLSVSARVRRWHAS